MYKKSDEEFEKVEAMSIDGKEGIESAKEIVAAELREEAVKHQNESEYFGRIRRNKDHYIHSLAELLYIRLYEYEFPQYVRYEVRPTDVGVVMELGVHGKLFRQAFKASGDPKYDLNAVDNFVIRSEYTVSKYHTMYAKRVID